LSSILEVVGEEVGVEQGHLAELLGAVWVGARVHARGFFFQGFVDCRCGMVGYGLGFMLLLKVVACNVDRCARC
jgi:hypothetical protein